MKFTKMHGIGNDYVYVNCFCETVEHPEEVARAVSDRHFGIGSDGLILIKPSSEADFEMEMYNADGSKGKMCGNGIRCVAKYVYESGLTDKTELRIATGSGVRGLRLQVEGGAVTQVCVDMGSPILAPEQIPVVPSRLTAGCGTRAADAGRGDGTPEMSADAGRGDWTPEVSADAVGGARTPEVSADAGRGDGTPEVSADAVEGAGSQESARCRAVVDRVITVAGRDYRMTAVSMGNPHCVVPVDDVEGLAIEMLGPCFERHPAFPERVNTEFIRVLDRRTVRMRVWERGSGETLACGTGACAVAVACILNGWTEDEVTVRLQGGELSVRWDRARNTVYMTGPATTVYHGEIEL